MSIKCCKKLAQLIEMRNFSHKFICIVESKKSIFLKQISDFAASITATTTCFLIFWAMTATFSTSSFSNYINVIFDFFEIDMKIEFAKRTTFDLMIDSKYNIIDVEFELKLIVNFSYLNDLKHLTFVSDSELTTTSIFDSITFWATIAVFFASMTIKFSSVFVSEVCCLWYKSSIIK